MRTLPILLLATVSAACGGGPTGPTGPAMPTGTILATAPTANLWLIDAATGDTLRFASNGEPLGWLPAALGPGARLASGVDFRLPWALRTVRIDSREIKDLLQLTDEQVVHTTRISPDERLVAFGGLGSVAPGENGVATVNLLTGTTQERWRAPDDNPELGLSELRWLPDQSGLVAMAFEGSGPKWVVRLDFATRTLTNLTEPALVDHIGSLDLAPGGRVIASALEGDLIRFVNLDGTPAPGYPTHLRGTFPTFSPDGKLLAFSRYRDGSLDIDGIWFYRFSDGALWRALPEGHIVTWVRDWE